MDLWRGFLVAVGCAVVALAPVHAAPATVYGARGLQFDGVQIDATRDGGSIVVGTQSVTRLGAVVIRFDAQGAPVWNRLVELPAEHVVGHRVRETADGFVVLATVGLGTGSPPDDLLVLQFDPAGSLRWQRRFQGRSGTGLFPIDVTAMPDGGSLLAVRESAAVPTAWLARLAADGSVLWQQSAAGRIQALQAGAGGEALVAMGSTLLRLDAAGQPVSARALTLDGAGATIQSVRPLADGGWLLAGSIAFGAFGARPWLVRAAADGAPVWARTYSAPDCGDLMLATDARPAPGGILMTVYSAFCGDYSVLKLDDGGAILWQGTQDYADLDPVMHVLSYAPTPDGGYVGTGTVADIDLPVRLLLIRADAAGRLPRCRAVTQLDDRVVEVPAPPGVQWTDAAAGLSPGTVVHATAAAGMRAPRLQPANACRL